MTARATFALLLAAALLGPLHGSAQAQEAAPSAEPDAAATKPGFGKDIMTPEEREAHRAKMRSFDTEDEREAYRKQHHQRMQERAAERGVALPDEPLPRGHAGGAGRGPGAGRGGGAGAGRGAP